MSTVFDLTRNALDLALEINAKCREALGRKAQESSADFIRANCVVQFDPGSKSGKSTWARDRAAKEKDWFVMSRDTVHNRIQYFDALAKAKDARVVVIDCSNWMLRSYDPSLLEACAYFAANPVKGRTIILLG